MGARWRNWAGNQRARPIEIVAPRSLDDVASLVARAGERAETVRCVGSGHSFTAAAVTDGHLVKLDAFQGVTDVDASSRQVTVGAGTPLSRLNVELHGLGLAMPNLGDIAYQTVAGAVSTSTHGTGARLPGLAAQVVGFTLVDGKGQVHDCSAEHNAEIFNLARVSLGALGVITQYRLQVTDAFRLRAVEQAMPLDAVLDRIDELVDNNDHFEFFWLPHTPWALTKRNNRTEDPLQPLPTVKGWIDKTFMENYAFGALCHLGRLRPSLIPRLATALPSSGRREYVEDSYKIFASPRLVRFYEMEHAIARADLPEALRGVRTIIEEKGYLLNFPVEVRFTAADDVPLSTSFERDSAYIAVHVFKGMEHEPFFRDVDAYLASHSSRPHWGKLHHRTAEQLRPSYRLFDDFLALRNRMDPGRVFTNRYIESVFGE